MLARTRRVAKPGVVCDRHKPLWPLAIWIGCAGKYRFVTNHRGEHRTAGFDCGRSVAGGEPGVAVRRKLRKTNGVKEIVERQVLAKRHQMMLVIMARNVTSFGRFLDDGDGVEITHFVERAALTPHRARDQDGVVRQFICKKRKRCARFIEQGRAVFGPDDKKLRIRRNRRRRVFKLPFEIAHPHALFDFLTLRNIRLNNPHEIAPVALRFGKRETNAPCGEHNSCADNHDPKTGKRTRALLVEARRRRGAQEYGYET